MEKLNEQKAFEIMDLNSGATKDDISKRYGILARKFRTVEKDDQGYTIDDITRAYNLLMGITYIDEKEEARQEALRENPPFLARILKRDPVKVEHFFYYHKVHILVSVILIITIFFTVRSCVNQVPSDFTVVFYGDVYAQNQESLSRYIVGKMPELANPEVHIMSANEQDPQYQMAMQMKLVAMMAASEIDFLIVSESYFEMYTGQGMFLPLDDILESLDFPEERWVQGSETTGETESGVPIKGPMKTYGIDITESDFVKENEVFGHKMIAGVVVNSSRMETAIRFLELLK